MKKASRQKITHVISLLQQGHSYSQIAISLSLSKATICRIKKKHLPNIHCSLPGRPRRLDARQIRLTIRHITSGRIDTAAKVAKHLHEVERVQVSASTVQRTLRKAGMKSTVKQKKPLFKPQHIRERLAFAQRHKDWTIEDWKRVIWSDETKINRFGADGRKWCWKKPGEQL
jgi:transposase